MDAPTIYEGENPLIGFKAAFDDVRGMGPEFDED